MSLPLALSEHPNCAAECPLLGVKRTHYYSGVGRWWQAWSRPSLGCPLHRTRGFPPALFVVGFVSELIPHALAHGSCANGPFSREDFRLVSRVEFPLHCAVTATAPRQAAW